jgi:hypothetical protein
MKNGHVNVCKECHKGRMRSRSRTNVKVQEYDKRRAKTPERIAKGKQITDAWRLNNPVAYSAHTAVSNAVRDGRLKKLPCEFCGEIKVHAHHKNYLEPLNVVWLCAKCHHRLHAMFPELEGKNKQIDRKENVDGTAHCRNRI